jgi:uncharacterized membrane protein YebE (DUF533 family)
MKIERPQATSLSVVAQKRLDQLEEEIKAAIADGKLSQLEMSSILGRIVRSGVGNEDLSLEELSLYRQMILDKVESGELEIDYYSD